MNRHSAIRSIAMMQHLPEVIVEAVAAVAVKQSHVRGTIITLEGEPAYAMYLVVSGRVKVVRHSLQGREQILHVVGVGDHFNTVPMFDGSPCPATTEALEDTTLLMLHREIVVDLVERYPAFALALLGEFAGRLRNMVDLVENLALHTVNGRLARLLIQQAEAAERGEIVPPLTQIEMASYLGTVREMIGRALKAFELQGLIAVERGAITITDRAGLAQQADL